METFQGLDVLGIGIVHTTEHDQRAVVAPDLIPRHIKQVTNLELLNLIDKELPHRILDAVLYFSDTDHSQAIGKTYIQCQLCKEMRLTAASTAVCALVPPWRI
ncbi:MAG: hypothetical protein JW384_01130 [Nitrosomonadaceae bacterium]|nr:hypothetical protein [Nitrosomonadaceae bacterium]